MIKSLIQCRDEVFLLDHVSVKEIFIMKILGSSYLKSMLGWFSQFFETIKYSSRKASQNAYFFILRLPM